MRVLELNDAGIRISDANKVLADSPGFAALNGKTLLLGEAARERHRLDPRRSQDRFWYQLDAQLDAPMAQARSAADLAHAHLVSLGEPLTETPLLVAAPGSFSGPQLGLFLGLLQAAGGRCAGLFDPAVAAASQIETRSQIVHLDVQLHRFIITHIQGNKNLQRQRVQEHKPGLAAIHDRCASIFAQAFVSQSRFDPLHNANTEQLLYNALPPWLQKLADDGSATLELHSNGHTHRATVDARDLAGTLSTRFAELRDLLAPSLRAGDCSLLMSARAAAIPGLAAFLQNAIALDQQAVARGALVHAELIATEDQELPWVTQLPRRALTALDQEPKHGIATHVLVGFQARALPAENVAVALSSWLPGAPGLAVRRGNEMKLEGLPAGSISLNGQPIQNEQAVHLGDRLTAGTHEVRLICVKD